MWDRIFGIFGSVLESKIEVNFRARKSIQTNWKSASNSPTAERAVAMGKGRVGVSPLPIYGDFYGFLRFMN